MDSNGGFILGMAHPVDTDSLSRDELKTLVEELLERVSALSQTVVEQREEIARAEGSEGPARYQAAEPTLRDGEGEPCPVARWPAAPRRRPQDGSSRGRRRPHPR